MQRIPIRITLVMLAMGMLTVDGCSMILRRGSSSSDYRITTNRDIYSRGSTGEATIRNISDKVLEYNLCPRRLERRESRYWIVAFEWPTAGGACTTEARSLSKDDTVNALFDIPTGVPTGTYRIVFTGLHDAKGRNTAPDQAATPSFEVR